MRKRRVKRSETSPQDQINELCRKRKWVVAARIADRELRKYPEDHYMLIKRGNCDHERYRYKLALDWFERAVTAAPNCPTAAYSRANALHMLGRDQEAFEILEPLSITPAAEIEQLCPDADEDGIAFLGDVYFLLVHVVCQKDRKFSAAEKYLKVHRELRRFASNSLWSMETMESEVRELRAEFPG